LIFRIDPRGLIQKSEQTETMKTLKSLVITAACAALATGSAATREYAAAAARVLTRRVKNAPKKESHWLPGWRNRLRTYAG
jgi:hypothetical protein